MKLNVSLLILAFLAIPLWPQIKIFGATPNIVIILTDDQGYADLSDNPNHPKEVATPNIDQLAAEGIFFTQAYTSGAVCSPTRAGLMLGQYQQRVGIYTAGDGGRGFNPKTPIFPSFLPPAYRSSAIGKWHLGLDNDYPALKWHAVNRGFTECYKFMGRGGHDYFELKGVKDDTYAPIYRNLTRLQSGDYEGYLTTRLTEEATAFIKRSTATPFFLYLAYNAVHAPAQAPRQDIKTMKERFPHLSEKRATLMAMLKHLDDGVGEVVNTLKEEKLWANTLLFFLTDNGGAKAMEADNGKLRGFKGSLYEGGIRTPWIVSWPNRFHGGRRIETPIISLDILPTVVEATQGKIDPVHSFDGKSILPLIESRGHPHHSHLFWDNGGPKREWAIRHGKWKLHSTRDQLELHNLMLDPSEKTNLAKQEPQIADRLKSHYLDWRKQVEASERIANAMSRERFEKTRRRKNAK